MQCPHLGPCCCLPQVMGVVALYYFLSVTYVLAFLRDALHQRDFVTSLYVSYGFDVLTLVNVCIKLNTSFIEPSSSVRVTDRRRILQRYLMTQYSVDLVGILPLDLFARYMGAPSEMVAWLRLPKLVFCHYLYSFFNRKRLSSRSRLMANVQVRHGQAEEEEFRTDTSLFHRHMNGDT